MTQGVSVSDIIVTVGAGHCNITSLARNRLVCKPPLEHPGHGGIEGPDDAVVVQVKIHCCCFFFKRLTTTDVSELLQPW